jgi:hypothetical protein
MKKLLILLPLITYVFFSYSQLSSGGPDNFGYTYRTSAHLNGPTYQWFDISIIGTNVLGLSDDNYVGPYSISGFPYYTSNPNLFYIGSNGYISFSPNNIASSAGQFPAIPLTSGPNGYIAPLLTDLNCGGIANPSTVYYYSQGDTVCVSFEKIPFWYNNNNQYLGDNLFQIILNKADSSITFNYKTQIGSPDPAYVNNALTIGMESPSGADGLQYYRGMTFPSTNFSIKFYFPSTVQTIYDASLNWIDNESSGGIFIKENVPFSPQINVKNTGNQTISDSLTISCILKDSVGQVLQTDSVHIDSLPTGSDSTKTVPLNYSPSYSGRFTLSATVSGLSNDQVPSNNSKNILLISKDTTVNRHRLVYTNDTTSIGGLSWIGGNGGAGIYVIPPFHPFKVETAGFFIPSIGGSNGFHAVVYDDNARGGGAGTLLDSTFVNNFQIPAMSYYIDTIRNPIVKNQGGVYLLWLMDGNGITLGRSFVGNMPPSYRTYEVIGGSWAEYRENSTQELMMYVEVSNPLITSISENKNFKNEIKVYPTPASTHVTIESEDKSLKLSEVLLFDNNGKLQSIKVQRSTDGFQINRGALKAGTYYIQLGQKVSKVIFID